MPTLLPTIRKFVAAVTMQAVTFTTGSLFTVAGWLWEGLVAVWPTLDGAGWAGRSLWIPGHLLIFYAAFLAWRDEHAAKSAIQGRLLPRAELVFRLDDPHCIAPGKLSDGPEWRYLVGIINLSDVTLKNCRLILDQTEPIEPSVTYLDQPLGDRLSKGGRFDVHPRSDMKPSKYVDVLQEYIPGQAGTRIRFTYAPDHFHEWMKHGKFFEEMDDRVVTVRLEGDDLPQVTLRLLVHNGWYDEDGIHNRYAVSRL